MEFLFLGIALGSIGAYFLFSRVNSSRKHQKLQSQSVVLMERIRSVCKFITVEGDFSEIYHYESFKKKWIEKFIGTKKALILIEAKAHVGFDLTKIKMRADTETKTIVVYNFPDPELLTIETDFKYYDKKEGWLNSFSAADLTAVNKEAKDHIISKIPESGLLEQASQQALDTVKLMESLVKTINWNLEYEGSILLEK